jgi:hypothetical protein
MIVRLTKTKSVTALAIVALLTVAGAVLFRTSRGLSRVVTSTSGQLVKLEAWHFKAAPVRYDLPNRPWVRRLEKWLPNPAQGQYPQWKAQPMPVNASDHGLEISLMRFRSYQSGAATFTKQGVYPRTQCSFRVRENGRDRRLTFVEAKDEHGRIVKLKGTLSDPGQISGQSPDLLPYSLNFQALPDARELTLVLAVSQSRFLEFLAQPEQVREEGSVTQN